MSEEYWIVPDGLDTDDFDFEWLPDPFDPPYIHVFGTQWQKTGGPRYVIEGATDIKYHSSQRVRKLPDMTNWVIPPNVDTTHFDFSWHPDDTEDPMIHEFGTQWARNGGPRYVVPGATSIKYHPGLPQLRSRALPTTDNWVIPPGVRVEQFDFSWHPDSTDDLTNYAFGDQRGYCIAYKHTAYPQYKYLQQPPAIVKYTPLDIVYLSNGEPHEELRYQRLREICGRDVLWVRGVTGRENAIKEAARRCSTEHYILFPGKLWADLNFDFDFQPRYPHEPQHYIFYAQNPVNNLVYGHQAAVCYNRTLVLGTHEWGLDFTMSARHSVDGMLSGVAQYNVTPHITWRTAFREAIKLRAANNQESAIRLEQWLTVAVGDNSEWSIRGARDGVAYYDSVGGDHQQLMLSFDWGWTDRYFNALYSDAE